MELVERFIESLKRPVRVREDYRKYDGKVGTRVPTRPCWRNASPVLADG